jgi:hypothetical protein
LHLSLPLLFCFSRSAFLTLLLQSGCRGPQQCGSRVFEVHAVGPGPATPPMPNANAPSRFLFSRGSCFLRHQQLRNEFSQDISQSETFTNF